MVCPMSVNFRLRLYWTCVLSKCGGSGWLLSKVFARRSFVSFNVFAFLRACRLNRFCARFVGFSGLLVIFGVLHASVQVIVDCTGLIMACINGLLQNVEC